MDFRPFRAFTGRKFPGNRPKTERGFCPDFIEIRLLLKKQSVNRNEIIDFKIE